MLPWRRVLLFFVLFGVGVYSEDESVCPGPGVYPHPQDRASFVICAGPEGSARLVKVDHCPDQYEFSRLERTCVAEQTEKHARVARATPGGCREPGTYCETCDQMVVCYSTGNRLRALSNISCSDIGDGLVCESKTMGCTTPAVNSSCAATATVQTFRCLESGFYPDDTDCKRYHICDENLVHYTDTCDSLYDSELGTCVDNATCTTAPIASTCSSSSQTPRVFTNNRSFYRMCLPVVFRSARGEVKLSYQFAVRKCPDRREFNEATLSCELVCKRRPDRMEDPQNCHAYYDCPAGDSTTTTPPVRKVCADGLGFDSVKKICAPESRVAACTQAHVITTRQVDASQNNTSNATEATPTTSATQQPNTTQIARPNQTSTGTPVNQTSAVTQVSPTNQTSPVTQATPATQPPTRATQPPTRATQPPTRATEPPTRATEPPVFRCTQPGRFPDRSNCRGYILCSRFWLQRDRFLQYSASCPFFMYFNTSSRMCLYGSCQ